MNSIHLDQHVKRKNYLEGEEAPRSQRMTGGGGEAEEKPNDSLEQLLKNKAYGVEIRGIGSREGSSRVFKPQVVGGLAPKTALKLNLFPTKNISELSFTDSPVLPQLLKLTSNPKRALAEVIKTSTSKNLPKTKFFGLKSSLKKQPSKSTQGGLNSVFSSTKQSISKKAQVKASVMAKFSRISLMNTPKNLIPARLRLMTAPGEQQSPCADLLGCGVVKAILRKRNNNKKTNFSEMVNRGMEKGQGHLEVVRRRKISKEGMIEGFDKNSLLGPPAQKIGALMEDKVNKSSPKAQNRPGFAAKAQKFEESSFFDSSENSSYFEQYESQKKPNELEVDKFISSSESSSDSSSETSSDSSISENTLRESKNPQKVKKAEKENKGDEKSYKGKQGNNDCPSLEESASFTNASVKLSGNRRNSQVSFLIVTGAKEKYEPELGSVRLENNKNHFSSTTSLESESSCSDVSEHGGDSLEEEHEHKHGRDDHNHSHLSLDGCSCRSEHGSKKDYPKKTERRREQARAIIRPRSCSPRPKKAPGSQEPPKKDGKYKNKICPVCGEKIFNRQDVACFALCEHYMHEYCLLELIHSSMFQQGDQGDHSHSRCGHGHHHHGHHHGAKRFTSDNPLLCPDCVKVTGANISGAHY